VQTHDRRTRARPKSSLLNRKDLIAYFLVAGTGAAVQILAGSLLRDHMGPDESVAVAYVISFFVGFTLTKLFAFDAKKSGQTRREMVKFGMVALLSWGITVGGFRLALNLFNSWHPAPVRLQLPISFPSAKFWNINVKEFSALLFGMGASFVSNYVMHKRFTFKSTGFYDRIKAYIR
jgi:putative flippase GtrA